MIASSIPLNSLAARRWDALVVGAGLAGPMAALLLARRGCSVLLVDKASLPRWKVCGACLNPYTLSVLCNQGLGDLPDQCGALPIRGMRLRIRGRHADIALPGWKTVARERLDAGLVEAAVAAGAVFAPRTRAILESSRSESRSVLLRRDDEEVRVETRLVIAADGLGGRLLAGDESTAVVAAPNSWVGMGAIADQAPDFYGAGVIHMAYTSAGYLGLVRLEDGRLNLAAALDVSHLRNSHGPDGAVSRLLAEVGWPALPDLVWRGTPALTQQPSRPAAKRVLAVGDAAGYVEPFTGEGMGWALASAAAVVPIAVRAIQQWQPALADEWTAFRRRAARRRERLCHAISWIAKHPTIARSIVGILSYLPRLAAPAVHRVRVAGQT